ncbi:TetR/AcrR family transcriptional regulator [Streptomyces sp. BBFR2]|uniref:TetR/AcrR family transcriptional regulator n=1 Tax=Streptomyces sp. BBFR2 TaxID=3372854 RepID=UPI0037D9BAEC
MHEEPQPGPRREPSRRADALRNRARILDAALTELTADAGAPLSAIARRAGVGQATFYRNFPSRECLVLEVYRHEVDRVAALAAPLLRAHAPDVALRVWLDRLARHALTKAGLAEALRRASAPGSLVGVGRAPVTAAVTLLLDANTRAGTIRPGVTPDDFLLAIAGLWQLDPRSDWQGRAARLLDLVMDGLRTGAPGP